MRFVNPYLVAAVLEPFLFLEPDEAAAIAAIGSSDERAIRDCIRNLLLPYFSTFDEKSKEAIKDTLGYMLLGGSDKWEALLAMNQCPLAMTDPPQQFFEWLWDEFFHERVYLKDSVTGYIVREDLHAPNLIQRGRQA